MTQKKRVAVTFTDEDWAKVEAMKQKLYNVSYSEVIRRAVNEGFKAVIAAEPRKADAAG